MKPVDPFEFLNIIGITNGDTFGYVQKNPKRELSLLEVAYCVALFDRLYTEYNSCLIKMVGEDRAYLLAEYQKLSIEEFRNTVETIKRKVDESLRAKLSDNKLSEAMNFFKEANSELFDVEEEE